MVCKFGLSSLIRRIVDGQVPLMSKGTLKTLVLEDDCWKPTTILSIDIPWGV